MNWLGVALKKSQKKIFELEGKRAFLSFRAIIFVFLLVFLLYGENGSSLASGSSPLRWALLIAGLQLASNFALAWVPQKFFKKGLVVGLFLADIVFISLVVYCVQGYQSDLFMIYFLVVFMTAVAKKPSLSFVVAGLSCLLYGFMFAQSHPLSGLLESTVLIRFSLLLVVALFSSSILYEIEAEKEAAVAQMQAYWIRSEKLAALGELASGVAHDINNPLTSVLGLAQLMLNEAKDDPELKDEIELFMDKATVPVLLGDLRAMERNAMRCKKVVSELLKFSSEHEFKLQRIAARRPLEDACSLLQGQMVLSRVNILWNPVGNPEELLVQGSPAHLQHLFFNLVNNAVHAMPDGGTLTLTLERKREIDRRHLPREWVEVRVEDQGPGIPSENLDHLFKPFLEVSRLSTSNGLGLVVARSIVDKHNGKISARNRTDGRGLSVAVQLPAAEPPDARAWDLQDGRSAAAAKETLALGAGGLNGRRS